MPYHKNPVPTDELRRIARQRFPHGPAAHAVDLSSPDAQALLEELEVRQIELERQNEYANSSRAQLEQALNQSNALYDFLPVGSLLLDRGGRIAKMNRACAGLIGDERARLIGSEFARYVSEADRAPYRAVLEEVRAPGEEKSAEIGLTRPGLDQAQVQLIVTLLPDGSGWQLILLDIGQRKRLEELLRSSEARWKLALEAAGDGVWDWNLQTGAVHYSERFAQLFGYDEALQLGQIMDARNVHPDDRPYVLRELQSHLLGETARYRCQFRRLATDGSWKWVLARGAVISRGADGKALRMIGTSVDISHMKRTEQALQASVQFQQAVFDALAAQVVVLDREGIVVHTNAAWRQYGRDNCPPNAPCIVGGKYLEQLACMTGDDQAAVEEVARGLDSVWSGATSRFALPQPVLCGGAGGRWLSIQITPVHEVEGRVIVSHEDVSKLKAAELASLTLANVDPLTGALSRRHFLAVAEQELARSRRYAAPLMVLMLDLDHFKRINDQHGHAAGDAVLQDFVLAVRSLLRESDLIGRLGGEEFAVLLPNTEAPGGRALAERIVERVRACRVESAGQQLSYTVSIGASCLSDQPAFPALLDQADIALYRAKAAGRDRLEPGNP